MEIHSLTLHSKFRFKNAFLKSLQMHVCFAPQLIYTQQHYQKLAFEFDEKRKLIFSLHRIFHCKFLRLQKPSFSLFGVMISYEEFLTQIADVKCSWLIIVCKWCYCFIPNLNLWSVMESSSTWQHHQCVRIRCAQSKADAQWKCLSLNSTNELG